MMLNFNKVGRPLAKIEGGTLNGMIVSASDHFASNADDDEDQNGLIQEFRQRSSFTRVFSNVSDIVYIKRQIKNISLSRCVKVFYLLNMIFTFVAHPGCNSNGWIWP